MHEMRDSATNDCEETAPQGKKKTRASTAVPNRMTTGGQLWKLLPHRPLHVSRAQTTMTGSEAQKWNRSGTEKICWGQQSGSFQG